MRNLITILVLGFLFSPLARAEVSRPTLDEPFSRALQQAKRVAAMENNNDVPSRTVHLGKRVAHHSQKLAKRTPKPAHKKTRDGQISSPKEAL